MQQLMQTETEEEESKATQVPVSPVRSVKMSSGAASQTSRGAHHVIGGTAETTNDSSRVAFINERRQTKECLVRPTHASRSRNIHKEAPDVKHMEKALLELLDDFHTGKLRAFGKGCSMEQMMNIRDQQEHLARLHFRLGADTEQTISNKETFSQNKEQFSTNSRDNMAQLVHSLEQLSASIENLHSGDIPSNGNFK